MIVVTQPGQCLSSIACEHGFTWQLLWNHPANRDLRARRKDPNVLHVGDPVFVPERRPNVHSRATRRRHSFILKGVPARVRIVFSIEGRPRRGQAYTLDIDGEVTQGALTGDGILDVLISPTARRGEIWFDGEDRPIGLELGHLEPEDTPLGVQQRLANLGFSGGISGMFDEATAAALASFQRSRGAYLLGQPTHAALASMEKVHEAKEGLA